MLIWLLQNKKETIYAGRHHDGSLCTQKQPETAALKEAIGLLMLYRMFPGGRQALWKEKLGLAPKFAGNAATQWGTRREADALLR